MDSLLKYISRFESISYWRQVNVGSAKGLMPPGNEPLRDSMLMKDSDVIAHIQWKDYIVPDSMEWFYI